MFCACDGRKLRGGVNFRRRRTMSAEDLDDFPPPNQITVRRKRAFREKKVYKVREHEFVVHFFKVSPFVSVTSLTAPTGADLLRTLQALHLVRRCLFCVPPACFAADKDFLCFLVFNALTLDCAAGASSTRASSARVCVNN